MNRIRFTRYFQLIFTPPSQSVLQRLLSSVRIMSFERPESVTLNEIVTVRLSPLDWTFSSRLESTFLKNGFEVSARNSVITKLRHNGMHCIT